MTILQNDWQNWVGDEFTKPYYLQLNQFLAEEYRTQRIYPNPHDIFNALHFTSYSETKVVILGQDPYHGAGQAHGLSFSVKPGVPQPPSLKNIFKELHDDLGHPIPNHGSLQKWAEQGVLLLNTVLTVREGQPNSHKGKGWERFTDHVIQVLNQRKEPIIFLLWGKHAQEKQVWITSPHHVIIQSAHPSPFSAHRGFFGSRPYSRTNELLKTMGFAEIDWYIPNYQREMQVQG